MYTGTRDYILIYYSLRIFVKTYLYSWNQYLLKWRCRSEAGGLKISFKYKLIPAQNFNILPQLPISCKEVVIHDQKYFFLNFSATLTRSIRIGTSSSGPITVANAWFELMPKIAIATAIASSKSLEEAVKLTATVCP